MYQNLKSEIKEIIEIVNQCPETLQEKCFELLLENFLNSKKNSTVADNKNSAIVEPNTNITDNSVYEEKNNEIENQNTEITINDFHVKVQRFLNNNNITIENINYLYYKEDGKLMPLYKTLNSTNMSECQVRLALLTAFENSFSDANGEMFFNCEVVRSRCNTMKCYNAKNFTSYFKSNSDFWEVWPDKYDKTLSISLSAEGKKELAKVILDLTKDE